MEISFVSTKFEFALVYVDIGQGIHKVKTQNKKRKKAILKHFAGTKS